MPQAGAVPGDDTYVVVTMMLDAGVGVGVAGTVAVAVAVVVAVAEAVAEAVAGAAYVVVLATFAAAVVVGT